MVRFIEADPATALSRHAVMHGAACSQAISSFTTSP
jgi:hypothetical protein